MVRRRGRSGSPQGEPQGGGAPSPPAAEAAPEHDAHEQQQQQEEPGPPRISEEIKPVSLADLFASDPGCAAAKKQDKGKAGLARTHQFAGAGLDDELELKKLQVFVRIRPSVTAGAPRWDAENCIHATSKHSIAIAPPEGSQAYKSGDRGQTYSFSRVFDCDTPQQEYYEQTAAPLVRDLLRNPAHNSVMMAYGITAAGKTYTIEGTREQPGVMPRALVDLFRGLAGHVEPVVARASYYEVYNEAIFDLLDEQGVGPLGQRAALRLKEDALGRVFVAGLSEVEVGSADEALALLRRGSRQRQRAETGLNYSSSRSHSIFTIMLYQQGLEAQGSEDGDSSGDEGEEAGRRGEDKLGRISFVDLAGSERAQRTGNVGVRLKESVAINSSLMTLGRCLEALRWNQQHKGSGNLRVVPYRESKVTHLFRDALHGWGQVILSVNVSPASKDYDETAHVLKYAALATQIGTIQQAEAPRRTIKAVSPAIKKVKRKAALPPEARGGGPAAKPNKKAKKGAAPAPAADEGAADEGGMDGLHQSEEDAERLPAAAAAAADGVPEQHEGAAGAAAGLPAGGGDEGVAEYELVEGHCVGGTPATPLGEDDEAVAALQAQVQQLIGDLQKAEERCVLLEAEVREEVADEMAQLLRDMEESYRQRLESETAALEAKMGGGAAEGGRRGRGRGGKAGKGAGDGQEELAAAREEAEQLRQQVASLTAELESARQAAEGQAAEAEQALAAAAQRAANAEEAAAQAKEAACQAERQLGSEQQAAEELRAQLSGTLATLTEVQHSLNAERQRASALEADLAASREQAAAAEEAAQQAAAELAGERERVARLTAELAAAQAAAQGSQAAAEQQYEEQLQEAVTQIEANKCMELEMAEGQAERLRKENLALQQRLGAALAALATYGSPAAGPAGMAARMAQAAPEGNGRGAGGTPHDVALARARQAAAAEDAAAAAAAAAAAGPATGPAAAGTSVAPRSRSRFACEAETAAAPTAGPGPQPVPEEGEVEQRPWDQALQQQQQAAGEEPPKPARRGRGRPRKAVQFAVEEPSGGEEQPAAADVQAEAEVPATESRRSRRMTRAGTAAQPLPAAKPAAAEPAQQVEPVATAAMESAVGQPAAKAGRGRRKTVAAAAEPIAEDAEAEQAALREEQMPQQEAAATGAAAPAPAAEPGAAGGADASEPDQPAAKPRRRGRPPKGNKENAAAQQQQPQQVAAGTSLAAALAAMRKRDSGGQAAVAAAATAAAQKQQAAEPAPEQQQADGAGKAGGKRRKRLLPAPPAMSTEMRAALGEVDEENGALRHQRPAAGAAAPNGVKRSRRQTQFYRL